MKCLIADDDLMSRFVLKKMLPTSFDIDIAVDGAEAIEAFRMAHASKRPYKLIFMDIEMPNMCGKEALFRIREIEREMRVPPELEVKVIMTSAHNDPKTVIDSFNKGGAFSYLVKPLDKRKLMPELRKIGSTS